MEPNTVDYGCFGYAPSPLDPWRGTGRIAKQMGLPVPAPPAQPMTKSSLFLPVPPPVDRKITVDPAVATIKIKVSKSPCPCGDEECNKAL